MGQAEVLEAVARLNDRLNRPVTKLEIAEETGTHPGNIQDSLAKLKRWREVEVERYYVGKKHFFRYTVPSQVREKIGV
jgi:hypothetical protein